MATKYTQDGDPLIPNTEWVRSLYYQLQRQIVVAEGVLSITAGQNINVDNTTPTAPVVSFEYPATTHAALLAQVQAETAEDGFYVLTDAGGGTHPMLVGVYNNTVTGLWLQAEKANGDLFLWQIEGYDFLNNSILVTCTDTVGNRFTADLTGASLYDYFPADDPSNSGNNIASGKVSDFSGFSGTINQCTAISGSIFLATNSNAVIDKVNLYRGRRIDVRAVTGGDIVENVDFTGHPDDTLTVRATGMSNVSVDLNSGISNYPVSLTLTANAIDFNESADKNWAGVVNVGNAGVPLKTINGLDKAPRYFKLNDFLVDWTDTVNINVSLQLQATWNLEHPASTQIGVGGTPTTQYVLCYNDGSAVTLIQVVDY